MKIFRLKHEDGLSELDYLEKVHKKVRVQELVKFNGKAYKRSPPKNNKYNKCPYHFYVAVEDIYSGNIKLRDEDGELVNVGCQYKLIIE